MAKVFIEESTLTATLRRQSWTKPAGLPQE